MFDWFKTPKQAPPPTQIYRSSGTVGAYPEEAPAGPPVFDAKEAKRKAKEAKNAQHLKNLEDSKPIVAKIIEEIQKKCAEGKTEYVWFFPKYHSIEFRKVVEEQLLGLGFQVKDIWKDAVAWLEITW